ncbi:MAG: hypothetical protein IJW55_01465 [Clostridia bacterium]|nr:hypothetical protein [Clostridia bacterium]
MKTWQNIKNWLCGGCVYFTAIALILILVNLMIDGSAGIAAARFLLIFPCGLCMSFGGMLWKVRALPRWIRILLLYIIDVLAVFLLLYLPTSASAQAATQLLMFVLFSVVYWIVFGLIMLISSRIRKLMEED